MTFDELNTRIDHPMDPYKWIEALLSNRIHPHGLGASEIKTI